MSAYTRSGSRLKLWIPFIIAVLVTPICILYAFHKADFGYGSYLPTKLLFPYMMGWTLAFGTAPRAVVLLSFLQIPLYGFVLGRAWAFGRFRLAVVLFVVHVTLALITVAFLRYGDKEREIGRLSIWATVQTTDYCELES